MAFIKCSYCGANTSDKSEKCVLCGKYIQKQTINDIELNVTGKTSEEIITLAEENYSSKNFLTAYNYYIKAAEMGNDLAMFKIAAFYENGDCGLNKDLNEALSWYIKASESGNYNATFYIGVIKTLKTEIGIDYDKAYEYFLLSVEQENPDLNDCEKEKTCLERVLNYALEFEGEDYDSLKDEYKKALFNLYYLLADKGVAEAQLKVGLAYIDGVVVEKNDNAAFTWLMEAAKQGNARAEYNIGRFYLHGWKVIKDISMAMNWFEKSGEHGYGLGYNLLANIYANGNGVPENFSKAQFYYEKSAELNCGIAYYNLGDIYEYGRNGITDLAKAFELFKYGADILNNPECQNRVGSAYNLGKEVAINKALAFEYWLKAAKQNYFWGNYNAAKACINGSETVQDLELAEELVNKCKKLMPNNTQVFQLVDKLISDFNTVKYNVRTYNQYNQPQQPSANNTVRYNQPQQIAENIIKCPTCGSTRVEKISGVNKAAKAAMFGFFSLGSISKTFKCNNCGYKW